MTSQATSGTIIVTGGRGFIGRVLCRHLAERGLTVCGVGHGDVPAGDLERSGLKCWRQGEVDFANLDDIAGAHGPIAGVVHLAGGATVGGSLRAPLEDFNRTCKTSAQLLDWIRQRSPATAALVVSSAAVYGAGYPDPIREDMATTPGSPYGTHKLVMEMLCRSYASNFGVRAVLMRLFSVYGEGLRKQLLWDLCTSLAVRGSARLGGTGREVRDWIHVADAAELIRLALPVASVDCPTINGGTGRRTSVASIAAEVADYWGGGTGIEFTGERRAGDPPALVADVSRASDLGFEARIELRDGLRRYVDWFRGVRSP
jgi:UDP-glucose 4-epimerase